MKILIAEDDTNIRLGLNDLLEDEGYETLLAANGVDAIKQFEQSNPDFVLLDIMMPKKDGYTVCREIRQQNAHVPVIFISAKSEEIDRVVGLELGADDYIMKPFGTREVIARIRAVTRRLRQSSTNTEVTEANTEDFTMADLSISPTALRANRDGTVIELSIRDISILQTLYRLQGKVVDRDTLFNECWGRDYMPSSRTLDQHVSKLRKMIEVDPKKPTIISTVHGIGYRFDP